MIKDIIKIFKKNGVKINKPFKAHNTILNTTDNKIYYIREDLSILYRKGYNPYQELNNIEAGGVIYKIIKGIFKIEYISE